MSNWIAQNWGLVGIISLYLLGYVIVKHFLKKFLISRSRKDIAGKNLTKFTGK